MYKTLLVSIVLLFSCSSENNTSHYYLELNDYNNDVDFSGAYGYPSDYLKTCRCIKD